MRRRRTVNPVAAGLALFLLIAVPGTVWAGWGHNECEKCHGNRLGIGLAVFTQKRDIPVINPNTGKPIQRIEAICLDCHGDENYKAQLKQINAAMFKDVDEASTAPPSAVLDELELKPANVGFRIIDLHQTHPVGIVPKKVKLPKESLGFKDEEDRLTCLGCHNHHPSNPNYKYLRWPPGKNNNLNEFCAHCHGDKIKPAGAEERRKRSRGVMK